MPRGLGANWLLRQDWIANESRHPRLNGVALRFAQGTTPLGEIRLSGAWTWKNSEGRLWPYKSFGPTTPAQPGRRKEWHRFGTTTIARRNETSIGQKARKSSRGRSVSKVNKLQILAPADIADRGSLSLQYATPGISTAGRTCRLRELVFRCAHRLAIVPEDV